MKRPLYVDLDHEAIDSAAAGRLSIESVLSGGLEGSPVAMAVEPKHDGMFVFVTIEDGAISVVGRNGKPTRYQRKIEYLGRIIGPAGRGRWTFAGEMMRGTQRSKMRVGSSGALVAGDGTEQGVFWLFDCIEHPARLDIRAETWDARRLVLEDAIPLLGWPFQLSPAYAATEARELWDRFVGVGGGEGIVLKPRGGVWGDPWGRVKAVATADYHVVGFTSSGAVSAGSMRPAVGSIRAGRYNSAGELVEVGRVGGLGGKMREAFASHPERYVGRRFEARGCGVFESGLLRHPVFARWRDDIDDRVVLGE